MQQSTYILDYRGLLAGRRLPGLDGIRALAVLSVMLGHFGFNAPGDLGVSAFFVLSGFLITWLLLKELDANGDVSLKRFYWRRGLRIFPAYYVFLVFSMGLDLFQGDNRIWPVVPSAIFYVVNYYNAIHGHPTNSIAHAWSLAVEEQFYLLWPLGFLLLARRGRGALVTGLGVAIVTVLSWRCIAYYDLGLGKAYVYNAFDCRFDNLAVGCLLAVLSVGSGSSEIARRLVATPWLPFLTLAGLVVSRQLLPDSYHYGPGFSIDAVLFAIFIVQMLQLAAHPLWSWLDHPVMRYLGTISYPLYLYHQRGLGLGLRFSALPEEVQFAIGAVTSVVVASGSYFVIERPFLRLKSRFESARGNPPTTRPDQSPSLVAAGTGTNA